MTNELLATESIQRTTYLVYIDDSGDEHNNVLSALCIPAPHWTDYLERWKKYRHWMYRKYKVSTGGEFHSVEVGSTKRGQRDVAGTALRLEDRNDIAVKALASIAALAEIRILSVYEAGPCGKRDLYAPLIDFVEEFCEFTDSTALVWFDGTADSLYVPRRQHHRRMSYSRRVLEDPRPLSSTESHLIQLADVAAYCTHQHMLNVAAGRDRGRTTLRSGYTQLAHLVWPEGPDSEGFPASPTGLGVRIIT